MAIGMSAQRGSAQGADEADAVHMRHLVVDQYEVEIAPARAADGLDRVEESGRLDEAVGLDMPFQEVEDGSAVVNQKRLGQHPQVLSND